MAGLWQDNSGSKIQQLMEPKFFLNDMESTTIWIAWTLIDKYEFIQFTIVS